MLKAEYQGNEGFYQGNEGFLQRGSVEHKGYAEARSTDCREGKERDGASDLLEAILGRDNLNSAHKRVKRNHGAAGIDGMTAGLPPWLKEKVETFCRASGRKLYAQPGAAEGTQYRMAAAKVGPR